MLSDMKLSDLFFNTRHERFDGLFGGDANPSREEMVAAIEAEAAEFADDYPEFGKDAEWYAKEFMERV